MRIYEVITSPHILFLDPPHSSPLCRSRGPSVFGRGSHGGGLLGMSEGIGWGVRVPPNHHQCPFPHPLPPSSPGISAQQHVCSGCSSHTTVGPIRGRQTPRRTRRGAAWALRAPPGGARAQQRRPPTASPAGTLLCGCSPGSTATPCPLCLAQSSLGRPANFWHQVEKILIFQVFDFGEDIRKIVAV